MCAQNLVICNAGFSTGLKLETLLEELSKYGTIIDVVMLREKSYCFVKCKDIVDAETIYNNVNGRSKLAQNDGVVYLSYCLKGMHKHLTHQNNAYKLIIQ